MNAPYSGNARPFVLVLAAAADRERVRPMLEQLDARNYALCGQDGKATASQARRACAVVAFLSAAFAADDASQALLQAAHAAGVAIVPVMLDEAEQPELTRRALMATNAIVAARYDTPEALAERLCSAPELANPQVTGAQKAAARRRTLLMAGVAVCALVLVGVLVGRAMGASGQMRAARAVAEQYGLTEEDLERIEDVVVVGDHILFIDPTDPEFESPLDNGELPLHWQYATEGRDDDEKRHWYWNEDGSEVQPASYDFSFLSLLPNLRKLSLVAADLSSMPSLAENAQLDTLMLYSDTLPDDGLAFLAGSTVQTMDLGDCDAVDLSPLNSCVQLADLILQPSPAGELDLTGLAAPALSKLEVVEPSAGIDSLGDCTSLAELSIVKAPELASLDFLEGSEALESLSLEWFENVADASALATCPHLRNLRFQHASSLADLGFLNEMPQLESLELFGVPFVNLDFLANVEAKDGFSLGFASSAEDTVDFSGLARIQRYHRLHVNLSGQPWANVEPYLTQARVGTLELNDCDDVDLATLPAVSDALAVNGGNLTSLSGIDQPDVRELRLDNQQYLTSLDGIDGMPALFGAGGPEGSKLEIVNCPRLARWDGIAHKALNRLELKYLYELPDFALLDPNEIRLEMIDGLTDLTCFDALGRTRLQSVELIGLDEVTSLAPLARLRNSGHLTVPPQLAEQAEALVDAGSFLEWDVQYPEGGWEGLNKVELLSLDELGTLPQALLGMVEHVALAGDDVVQQEENVHFEWDERENGGGGCMVRVDDLTDEREPCTPGTLTSLNVLAPLTGLRDLCVWGEPLTSLDGLEALQELEHLEVNWCPNVQDFSVVFTLPNLHWLNLPGLGLDSIQGIQNLVELEGVTLSWNDDLEDLTPLLELPNLREVRVSDTMEKAIESLGDDYGFELEVEPSGEPDHE